MILRNKLAYAWSDLRLRRLGSAKTVVLTVFVSALSVLLLAFYGLGVRGYMDRSVSSDLLARVAVDLPTGDASVAGGLEAKLEGWRRLDAVAGAWPRIEVTADAIAGTNRMPSISVEGVDVSDPLVDEEHLAWGCRWAPNSRDVAVVSRRFLMQMGGQLTADGPSIRTLRLELRREVEQRSERESVELKICGVLADTARSSGERDTLIVPLVLTQQLDRWLTRRSAALQRVSAVQQLASFPEGATLYARKDRLGLLERDLESLRVSAHPETDLEVPDLSGPVWLGIAWSGGPCIQGVQIAHWGTAQRWTSLVPVAVSADEEVLVAGIDAQDPRWPTAPELGQHHVLSAVAPLGDIDWLPPSRQAGSAAPCAIGAAAVMTTAELARRFWCRGETPDRRWRLDFRFEDAYALEAALRTADRCRWSVQQLSPIERVSLVSHRLEDLETQSAALSTDLLADIAKARASVYAVVPNCSTPVVLRGVALEAVGTTPSDPRRFLGGTLYGGWITGATSRQVVLPMQWCQQQEVQQDPMAWLGSEVLLECVPSDGDAISVPFTVVGFTTEATAFLKVDDVQQLNACAAGALFFDASDSRFVDPNLETVGGGARRATVMTAGVEGLREFIAHVTPAGGVVHHRLSELERAREFGDTIALYALALAALAVALGALMSWNITKVYLKSKVREVAILRSLGMAPGEVGRIFGLQGLILGAPAFALALIVAVAVEPLLSGFIGPALGASSETAFAGRFLSWGNTPLYALGGAASVGLGVVASFWGASAAAKRPLADSLKPAD